MGATTPPWQGRIEDWLRESLGAGARIDRVTQLGGGLSEAMFRLDLSGAGVPAVVLRRWPVEGAWERRSARCEATVLAGLSGSGIGAPGLIASDPEGDRAGRPATLMSLLPGAPVLDPTAAPDWIDQVAEHLARIHALPVPPALEPAGWFSDLDDPERQRWMAAHPRGAEVLELAREPAPSDPAVLSHGDYQHFNLMWCGGTLTGVVDWTVSGPADRGKDLGHAMLNLAVLHGPDEACELMARYEAVTGRRVSRGHLLRELLDFSPAWERFIPVQVGGRVAVDPPGMRARVDETITRLLRLPG